MSSELCEICRTPLTKSEFKLCKDCNVCPDCGMEYCECGEKESAFPTKEDNLELTDEQFREIVK